MRRNRKPILSKIQNVMGIKNGKYCSSDVSVASINGNNGAAVPAVTESVQQQSVTYTNCPNRETFTIDFTEVENNGGIIPDCVLGGSVTLTNLDGYIVNYGQTICPVTVKEIKSCDFGGRNITVDFGDNVVTDGKVYSLSFNGILKPGCYTIIGDSLSPSEDSVSSVQEVPDCLSCTPTPTITPPTPSVFVYQVGSYSEINACNKPSGTTQVYSSSPFIEVNTTFLYTNQELTIPYYSFGLVNYNTKSGTFTLGTGFDGKVTDLNPCV